MKTLIYFSMAIAVGVASTMFGDDMPQKLESISSASLNQRDVMGELNLPLGKVTQVMATMISGDSTRSKARAGLYLLQVHAVAGMVLPSKPLLEFEVDPGVKVKELEKNYVGKKVKLVVYETGHYTRIPEHSNTGVAGVPFRFRTYLVVLDKLDPR